jgi:Fe-S-cluster containining protein
MALDEVVDIIANALRETDRRQGETHEAVGMLRARLNALVEVLVAKDVLAAQHQRHFDRCGKNPSDPPRRVRLEQYRDKYDMVHGEPVDCADRIPICKARCCMFTVTLTEQDLDEGQLKWNLDKPYVLRRASDGRCIYQDRTTGFCGNYEHRPALCRAYSCKTDKRIWLDFENKIPAVPQMTAGGDDIAPGA